MNLNKKSFVFRSPWLLLFFCSSLFLGCQSFLRSDSSSGPQKSTTDTSHLSEDPTGSPGQLKHRILILPLLGEETRFSQDFRERTLEAFRLELMKRGPLIPLDPKSYKMNLDSKMSGNKYDLKEIAAEARRNGIAGVLEPTIVDLKVKSSSDSVGIVRNISTTFEAQVNVRIFHINQGKEVFNTTKTVVFKDQNVRVAERVSSDRFISANPEIASIIVKDALLEFVPQVAQVFQHSTGTWQGRIASIQGDRYFLNVGQISGLRIGDILKVSEDGEEVFDPQTGLLIGQAPGRVKGTVEVISYFGKDGAIAIIHSGAGFRENDKIQPYQ